MNTEPRTAQPTPRPSRWRWLRAPTWLNAPLWSPKGFVLRAAAIVALYVLLTALDWRACTSVVCGTSPTGNVNDGFVIFKGCAYAVSHFMFVLGVPMLLLAAGVYALLLKRAARALVPVVADRAGPSARDR